MSSFNTQRIVALGLYIISSILVWYMMVLISNPVGKWTVTLTQLSGLGISMLTGLLIWWQRCLVFKIQP